MASRFLRAFGLFALLALFGASVAALLLVKERVQVTIAPGESEAGRAPPPWASTQDEVAALRADLRALADEFAALRAEMGAPAAAPHAGDTPASAAAPRKKSFLRFELPSDSFAFDRRARLALIPSLSRVGFDAKSTLHDFSGATAKVAGELTANLAAPDRDVAGRIEVDAASLSTDLDARDEAMREHLATKEHPTILFEWTGFRSELVDSAEQRVKGVALGKLTIRGVTREVEMAVAVSVDASKRVVIEGALPIKLSDFSVPIPSQLGVIGVEDTIKVWIALRARSAGAAEEPR
jgi:polyisoprenoid-binding protein YceI